MKTPIRVGLAAALALGLGYAFYRETHPRGDRLSRGELLALVPPEFHQSPSANPAGVRRMREVVALIHTPGPWMRRLEAILDEGPLRISETESHTDREARHRALALYHDRFQDVLEKLIENSTPPTGPAPALLVTKFVSAFESAGGDIEDAEILDAAGPRLPIHAAFYASGPNVRRRCLAFVPTEGKIGSQLAVATVADFRRRVWPLLIQAAVDPGDPATVVREVLVDGIDAGNLDARETARLFIQAARLDLTLCRTKDPGAKAARDRLVKRIEATRLPMPNGGAFRQTRYRWALNHHPNTLGRLWFLRWRHWRRWNPDEVAQERMSQWKRMGHRIDEPM